MKKLNYITMLLTAAFTMTLTLSVPVYADESDAAGESSIESGDDANAITCGDYEYILNEDDTATLSRYLGEDAEIIVPAEVDGHNVAILGGGIFANKDYITSVALPKTLTELKDSCFYGCTALETISVADGNTAFQLKDDVLFSADGTKLYCYPPAKEGTSYAVPDGVVEIWSSAFANTALTDVSFPSGLLYVDDWTFSYSQLTEVNLPDSVVEIGGYAFAYCPHLTEIDLPSSLEVIDAAAFSNNANLTKVTLPDGLQTIQMAAFAGTGLTEVTIPASVTYIGFCAFGYEADMKTTVPDFVIYGEVGSQAEVYCTDTDEENDYENHFTFCSILSASEDSSGADSPVQIEAKEKSPLQSAVKWILMGAGGLILLVGGLILLFSGRKKNNTKKSASKAKKQTEETTKNEV